MKKLFLSLSIALACFTSYAQSADDIINESIQALGGKNWEAVNGLRMTTVLDQGGMKIPLEVVILRDGRTFSKVSIQGMEIIQGAFDGETLWNTNFMTQKPEKAEADDIENTKRQCKEFPSALHIYKSLGYTATLQGEENVDGVQCHKIKLDKKTQLAEGKEVPNVEYHYIDKDTKALIMSEEEIASGEMKGKMVQTKFSDYQEVNGVMLPFSNTYGMRDGESQTISFEKVEVNPVVADDIFKFKGE